MRRTVNALPLDHVPRKILAYRWAASLGRLANMSAKLIGACTQERTVLSSTLAQHRYPRKIAARSKPQALPEEGGASCAVGLEDLR